MIRNRAKRTIPLLAALALSALSHAGDFAFTPGSWTTSATGNASNYTLTTKSDPNTIASSLGIQALASGTYTVQGTWTFRVKWTPASASDTPPTSVKVTLWRAGTPTVAGSGVAKITSGASDLVNVDSTLSGLLSGITAYLPNATVTLPLVGQSDGTYLANGSLDSDVVSVTYDAQNSTQTRCNESFSLSFLEAIN